MTDNAKEHQQRLNRAPQLDEIARVKEFKVFNSQTFSGPVKPFCPCDTGHPQDRQAEDWPQAHAERPCQRCGYMMHQHQELFWCPLPLDSAK